MFMSAISENISIIRHQLPPEVRLIAVSKTKSVSDILEAYNAGQRSFGENRVQELLTKKDSLPRDTEWHLIGHLQTNKVRSVVPFIGMIQSVDSFRLLETIDSEASDSDRVVDCLLQIHIAEEETKFGFSMTELHENLGSGKGTQLKNIRICGVMGMATFTNSTDKVRKEFKYLHDCFNVLKDKYFGSAPSFREISMGMSGDYEIALQEGSTMVRIGSLIFGERNSPEKDRSGREK